MENTLKSRALELYENLIHEKWTGNIKCENNKIHCTDYEIVVTDEDSATLSCCTTLHPNIAICLNNKIKWLFSHIIILDSYCIDEFGQKQTELQQFVNN